MSAPPQASKRRARFWDAEGEGHGEVDEAEDGAEDRGLKDVGQGYGAVGDEGGGAGEDGGDPQAEHVSGARFAGADSAVERAPQEEELDPRGDAGGSGNAGDGDQ